MSLSANSDDVQSLSAIDFQPSVENIDDGYALCDKDTLALIYSNATFTKWFHIEALRASIADAIPDLKTDVLLKRLNKRGAYLYVLEFDDNKWDSPQRLDISFKPVNVADREYISMHARNMSKVLEKEAQLFGHARIVERANRDLTQSNELLQAENDRLKAELQEMQKLQK